MCFVFIDSSIDYGLSKFTNVILPEECSHTKSFLFQFSSICKIGTKLFVYYDYSEKNTYITYKILYQILIYRNFV